MSLPAIEERTYVQSAQPHLTCARADCRRDEPTPAPPDLRIVRSVANPRRTRI